MSRPYAMWEVEYRSLYDVSILLAYADGPD